MSFINRETLLQLKDAVFQVHSRKDELAISTMFNIEITFAADILLKGFNMKVKPKHLEFDPFVRIQYQRENPIDWETTKCFICNFPLNINVKGLGYNESDMSYIDFAIRKEHIFLRNIYEVEDLNKSKNIKNIEFYYAAFDRFLKILKCMENELKDAATYDDIYNDDVRNFLEEECPAWSDSVEDLMNDIKAVEIKNLKTRTPKLTLQIYAFVYDILMNFRENKFVFKTVTTQGFFENLYSIVSKSICTILTVAARLLAMFMIFVTGKLERTRWVVH